jgi:hypothetical protein
MLQCLGVGLRDEDAPAWFTDQSFGFWGLSLRIENLKFRISGFGFRVQGSGFSVWVLGTYRRPMPRVLGGS